MTSEEAATVAWPGGVRLELHPPPDYVSDHIRRTGDFYEAAVLDEISARLRDLPPGILVDAGAMIGNHTAYLAVFVPHTRVIAFEPAPVNLDLLRVNVALYPTVTIAPIALSDRSGWVDMLSAPDNRGWTTIAATDRTVVPGMDPFRVRAMPLDALFLEDVRLLKVDVERHEHLVLAGARRTIARSRPLIVIEDWERDLAPVMAELGYRVAVDWGDAHQTYLYEPV